jgi:hypothetical protein
MTVLCILSVLSAFSAFVYWLHRLDVRDKEAHAAWHSRFRKQLERDDTAFRQRMANRSSMPYLPPAPRPVPTSSQDEDTVSRRPKGRKGNGC